MKKIIYIFLVIICSSATSFGQITIDSMVVYQTPGFDSLANTVDSIYISGTSEGQVLTNTQFIAGVLDGSARIILHFEGCDSINPTFFNTKIVYGYPILRITAFTKWDTTANCSYPIVPFYTDTLFWYDTPVNTDNLINEKQVKIYPNPARDYLMIELNKGEIQNLRITDMLGKTILEQFKVLNNRIDIGHLASGTYILTVEDKKGSVGNFQILKR